MDGSLSSLFAETVFDESILPIPTNKPLSAYILTIPFNSCGAL